MPFQPSPLLHGSRPATSWRAHHDAARALDIVEQFAVRLLHAPNARLWLASDMSHVARELTPVGREVLERNGPLAVSDSERGAKAPLTAMMRRLGWRALLAVPLHDASGAAFAVLMVADSRERSWTEQEVLLLRELAMLASLAHPHGRGDVRIWLQRMAIEAAREARRNLEAERSRRR